MLCCLGRKLLTDGSCFIFFYQSLCLSFNAAFKLYLFQCLDSFFDIVGDKVTHATSIEGLA